MYIYVETSSGAEMALQVERSDTIESVKLKIQDLDGTPPHQQRLIFGGWVLDSSRTLASYGIEEDSILVLRPGRSAVAEVAAPAVAGDHGPAAEAVAWVPPPDDAGAEDSPAPPAAPHAPLPVGAAAAEADQRHMNVKVKTLTGRQFSVPTGSSETIAAFKAKLRALEGLPSDMPVNEIRLIYAGKQLDDGRTLAAYKITDESTVHHVLRLSGK